MFEMWVSMLCRIKRKRRGRPQPLISQSFFPVSSTRPADRGESLKHHELGGRQPHGHRAVADIVLGKSPGAHLVRAEPNPGPAIGGSIRNCTQACDKFTAR